MLYNLRATVHNVYLNAPPVIYLEVDLFARWILHHFARRCIMPKSTALNVRLSVEPVPLSQYLKLIKPQLWRGVVAWDLAFEHDALAFS